MSFYEDNVADGSHCGSCCQYIGADVGYARFCLECQRDQDEATPAKTAGLTKSQKSNARKRRAKAKKQALLQSQPNA